MPNPTDYTVGWICAVGEELVAAQSFLDEKHDAPDHVPANDNNTYTLGRLGKHNTVIAAMPHWQYGLVNAAVVARDMVRSFPNVRIGLMVGIAGGAPSPKHDIRLGDIVVASPGYANGGVLQYDYGMTIQNSEFRTTGYLNQSPLFILNAISALKAEYEADGHTIDTSIQSVLEKKRRLRTKYCRPDPTTDRLYQTHWTHAGNNDDDCHSICGTEHLIPRPERSDDEDNPAIHYGLIASANQLMKNALLRDKLSADKDVLCFEMEAAGLMNHFPCLVIRGICDYSDTHKNVQWQGYAAMTAAAYAKDLLCKIAPNKVESERRLVEVLQEVQEDVKEVKSGVQSLRAEAHFDHINKWLSPPDPSTNFNNALKSRHLGSGRWFLDHEAYSRWKSERNSFLWLHGIPGCGKTVLSSTVIEDLSLDETVKTLLYFYFDFNDVKKQSSDMMLRSLISQMYDSCENVRSQVDSLYSAHNKGKTEPSSESLHRAFQEMTQKAGEAWIVLDALDECPTRNEHSGETLLSWISHLHDSRMNVHLLITSRPEQDIEAAIKGWAEDQNIIPLQSNLIQGDINAYVRKRVREKGMLSQRWRTRPDIQADIETTLTEKADGMFRWVSCQLDVLENCIGPPDVREALARLPRTLDETYARILANIPTNHKQKTIRILQFLTFSERPLSLEEAVDCITVDTNATNFDPKDRIPVPEEISSYCSSLVVIAETQGSCDKHDKGLTVKEIRLAHFSVKEYLISSQLTKDIAKDLETSRARMSLASVCLIYLLSLEHHHPVQKIQQLYPLATYAARYWTAHVVAVDSSSSPVRNLIADLFNHREKFGVCYELYPIDIPWRGSQNLCTPPVLYYASFAGLYEAVHMLLDEGADINAPSRVYGNALDASRTSNENFVSMWRDKDCKQGGQYGNALTAASWGGHERIVQILLDKGADVNSPGGEYGNALQAASWRRHGKVVQMLLNKGANVNAQGGQYDNALTAASWRGHWKIVQMLLDQGAGVDLLGGEYGSALQAASQEGHEKIVQILLNKGADVNAQGGQNGNALTAASSRGHERIVQMLLNKSTDINTPGEKYGNALQAASWRGHGKVVQMLLEKGADVNSPGGQYGNALQAASYRGHGNIVQMLLDQGANINSPGGWYGNAFKAALQQGHEEIVQILLNSNADVNAQGRWYDDTFYVASREGHEKVVQMLLDKGADINSPGGEYGNALQAASWRGHEKIVQMLLDKGADVKAQGGQYGNALTAASWRGHGKIVQMLLEKGADINSPSGHYGNALQAASQEGHEKIVQILLDKGADVKAQGGYYGNALQAASSGGHDKIVEILLNKGADVNIQSGHFGNALQAASYGGHEKVVEILLNKGADVNMQSGQYGNALQAASSGGHEIIVEMLLNKGADINAQGGYFGNALQAASFGGHEIIIDILLNKGAEVNTQSGHFGNALQAASFGGHEKMVEILLDKGADIKAQGGFYGNALQAASFGGHKKMVEILLDKGADVNTQGRYYGNALQAASFRGHEKVVEILLDKGAEVNIQSGQYGNALQAASYKGHGKVIEILLDKGADVNIQGGHFGNALYAASEKGHEKIVEILLNKGADVNIQGGYFGNALQAASLNGHKKIVEILLDKGADVDISDTKGRTALYTASSKGHVKVVKPLLEQGADLAVADNHG